MRLNRGTLILLVVSIIVIAAVLILNNNPTDETATVTPTLAAGGPLFSELAASDILSLTVRANDDESTFMTISRADADSEWSLDATTSNEERNTDQGLSDTAADNFATMAAETGFAAETLADFGLDAPEFTMEALTAGGETLTVNVGTKNPASTRYYIQVMGDETVYLVPNADVDPLTRMVASPPYEPLPTATPTATATLNPLSEVEQATATAETNLTVTAVLATLDAESTVEVTAEATAEAE